MSYASPDDVAARLATTFTAAQSAQAQAFLDDAEAEIKVRIPDLDARITAGTITVASVIKIEANAVRKVMLNPKGAQSRSEGWAGGFTHSETYSADFAAGVVCIDQEDLNELEGGASLGSMAFAIPMSYSLRYGEPKIRRPWEYPGYWWS